MQGQKETIDSENFEWYHDTTILSLHLFSYVFSSEKKCRPPNFHEIYNLKRLRRCEVAYTVDASDSASKFSLDEFRTNVIRYACTVDGSGILFVTFDREEKYLDNRIADIAAF